jgi:hypothetical protein
VTLIPTIRQVWDVASGISFISLIGIGGYSAFKMLFAVPSKAELPTGGPIRQILKFNKSRTLTFVFGWGSLLLGAAFLILQTQVVPSIPAKGHIPHHLRVWVLAFVAFQGTLYLFFLLFTYFATRTDRLFKKL